MRNAQSFFKISNLKTNNHDDKDQTTDSEQDNSSEDMDKSDGTSTSSPAIPAVTPAPASTLTPSALLTFANLDAAQPAVHLETAAADGTKVAIEYAGQAGSGKRPESAELQVDLELKAGAKIEIADAAYLAGTTAYGELVVAAGGGTLVLDTAADTTTWTGTGTGVARLIGDDGTTVQALFSFAKQPTLPPTSTGTTVPTTPVPTTPGTTVPTTTGITVPTATTVPVTLGTTAPTTPGTAPSTPTGTTPPAPTAAPDGQVWTFTLTDATGKATSFQSGGSAISGLIGIAEQFGRALTH